MSSDKNGQQRRRTMSQMLLTVRHWGSDPWNMLWGNILAGYSGNPLGPFALSLSIEVRTNTFLYCLGKLFKQQDITKTSSSLVVHPLGHLWMSQLVPVSFLIWLMAQVVKKLSAMQETQVQFPGWGRSPGEGNGSPLQYSCLENIMDRGAWWATVHGVAKSQTRLSD